MSLNTHESVAQTVKQMTKSEIGTRDARVVLGAPFDGDSETADLLRSSTKAKKTKHGHALRSVTLVAEDGSLEVHIPLGVPEWMRRVMEAEIRNVSRPSSQLARLRKKLNQRQKAKA